jgi:hypothetical protein
MQDLVVAVDQGTVNSLVAAEETDLQLGPNTVTRNFGPFFVSGSATGWIPQGTVTLVPPNILHIANFQFKYRLGASFGIHLDDFLPTFCLPRVCLFGFCTPKICVDWPDITVPFSTTGLVTTTADLRIDIYLDNTHNQWNVDAVLLGVPSADLSAQAAALLGVIEVAITAALLLVPFIGPFLSAASVVIFSFFDVAALAGFLGDILSLLLSGLRMNLIKQDKLAKLLDADASGPYPALKASIDNLDGTIASSDKTELVLSGSLSFP